MCPHACDIIEDWQFSIKPFCCFNEFSDVPLSFLDVFKEHFPKLIQSAHIASATTHLIEYLCTKTPLGRQGFLRFQRRSSRRLRPWFQAERNGMRGMVTVRRRFKRAAAPYTLYKMSREEHDDFLKFPPVWEFLYYVGATSLVRDVQKCSPFEGYWEVKLKNRDPDWWWSWKHLGSWQRIQLGPALLSRGYATREALQALPRMLHHSPQTPELISLLSSNLVFSSVSFVFPEELHAAKQAISRFLRPTVNSRRMSQ